MQGLFDSLSTQAREGRFPHALLIEGTKGLGKTHLARCLVAALLCEKFDEFGKACGVCKHCELLRAGSHGNFRLVQPEEGAKQIKIDAIRALSEFVAGSSLLGGRKVVVLAPAEAMNISSSNALLKTLEEPAGDTVLILVTHAGGNIMPTIRSRCQVVKPVSPVPELLEEWLQSEVSVSKDELQQLSAMAPGAPLHQLALAQEGALEGVSSMLKDLSYVLKRTKTVSELAGSWANDNPIERVKWVCQWAGQLVKCSLTGDQAYLVHPDSEKMFSYLISRHTPLVLSDLYASSLESLHCLQASNNLNVQLVLEKLLGEWLGLMSKRTLAA